MQKLSDEVTLDNLRYVDLCIFTDIHSFFFSFFKTSRDFSDKRSL